jgi:hypothetical protein
LHFEIIAYSGNIRTAILILFRHLLRKHYRIDDQIKMYSIEGEMK